MDLVLDIQNPKCDPERILNALKRWVSRHKFQNEYYYTDGFRSLNLLTMPQHCFSRRVLRYWLYKYHWYALDGDIFPQTDIEKLITVWVRANLIYIVEQSSDLEKELFHFTDS